MNDKNNYKFNIESTLIPDKHGYKRKAFVNLNITGKCYTLIGIITCIDNQDNIIPDIKPLMVYLNTGPETTNNLDNIEGINDIPIIKQIENIVKISFEQAIIDGEIIL